MHHARPKPGSAHRARSTPAIATSSGDNGGGQGVMRSSSDPPRFGAPERSEAAVGPSLAWKIVTLPIFGSLSLIFGSIWAVRYRPRQHAIWAARPRSRAVWVARGNTLLGSHEVTHWPRSKSLPLIWIFETFFGYFGFSDLSLSL